MANETIDARGLSCPQPVLMAVEVLKKLPSGTLEVLVDSECSKENVMRAGESRGWKAEAREEGGEWRLVFSK